MGSLSSVITPMLSFGSQSVDKIQQLNEINAKNKQLAQNAALQKQSNLLAYQQKETDRLAKLKAALSTQRANFGAQGVGSVTGSADSVFQGINEASDIQRQNNQNSTALDNAIIDQNLKSQQNLNLLQKQQLTQKSALGVLSGLLG